MSHTADTAIYARGIKKSFKQIKAVDRVDLTVPRGSVFALLGPNGAGKTTMVHIFATLLKPDDGHATVASYDVVRQPDAIRRSISLTGQYAAVDELLTGEENMLMMGRLYHLQAAHVRRRAAELLQRFDLTGATQRPVKTYSGGMRRRLDLAISLIAAPAIIFLDEPTTGLDPRSRSAMWEIIKELVSSGVTVFLTTQYLEEADQLADTIAVMDSGKIIAEGTAAQLKQRVGRELLELVFADHSSFQQARALLDRQVTDHDPQTRQIRIALSDSAREIKQVLTQLEDAAIAIEAIALHKPTLDDVFFRLTGRQAKQAAEDDAND
jgi:ABC-2 type transport system ATP-binding protein